MTSLTLYGTTTNSSDLSTANTLVSSSGGSEGHTSTTTAGGSGNGYLEVLAQGGSGVVYASLPTPTGFGWLSSSLLEEQTISAGTWSATIQVIDEAGSGPVLNFLIRVYKRSSSDVYTFIGELDTGGSFIQDSQSSSSIYALSEVGGDFSSVAFSTGDKLYVDMFIEANGWGGDIVDCFLSNSSSGGVAPDLVLNTPGYIGATNLSTITRTRFLTCSSIQSGSREQFKVRSTVGSKVRSKFLNKSVVSTGVRSKFSNRPTSTIEGTIRFFSRSTLQTNGCIQFKIRSVLISGARSKFSVSGLKVLFTQIRVHFLTRSSEKTQARSKFLIPVSLVIPPLYSSFTIKQLIQSSFKRYLVVSPSSTITSTANVYDVSNTPITDLSTIVVTLTYPDGSTASLSLGHGVTNTGLGNYTAEYNTKTAGVIREDWSVLVQDGTTEADFTNYVVVGP
jgi:hypothetical protein